MTARITLEETPDEAAMTAIGEGLSKFNEQHVGPDPTSHVWVVARGEDGSVVGGLHGVVCWRWFYVNMLWLDEPARGAGLGSSLLRRAEAAARDRGCLNVYLYTFSFQAPDFYRRHGYEAFGELEDFPGENRQFWMRKSLAAG